MDKGKAMKLMAESHRETVNELEDRIYAIGESYRQEREYNHQLEKQNEWYRERLEYMLAEAKDHKEKGLRIQHWALIRDLEKALEGDPHESK